MNIIFFVFVGLERKVFVIPQLSPTPERFPKGVLVTPLRIIHTEGHNPKFTTSV